jgi:hypothetical protein
LNSFNWKTPIIIFFDKFIKRGAEGVEDKAKVTRVIKRVLVSYDSFFVSFVSPVDALDYFFLDAG